MRFYKSKSVLMQRRTIYDKTILNELLARYRFLNEGSSIAESRTVAG